MTGIIARDRPATRAPIGARAVGAGDTGEHRHTDLAGGPESVGRLANGAWEALMAAHASLVRQMAAADVWDGVSMREYDVLYTLFKCGAPIAQGELERHVLLSQPAISRLVDRLVARGLVCRSADPADGRRVLLALTEAGRVMQRRIGARHARDVARAVATRLSRGEIAQLWNLADKLSGPPD